MSLTSDAKRFLQLHDAGLTTADDPIDLLRRLLDRFEIFGRADQTASLVAGLRSQISDLETRLAESAAKVKTIDVMEQHITDLKAQIVKANERTRLVEHENILLERSLGISTERHTHRVKR